jgi:hypothetical protein
MIKQIAGNRYAASTRGDTIESKQDHFSNRYKCNDIANDLYHKRIKPTLTRNCPQTKS